MPLCSRSGRTKSRAACFSWRSVHHAFARGHQRGRGGGAGHRRGGGEGTPQRQRPLSARALRSETARQRSTMGWPRPREHPRHERHHGRGGGLARAPVRAPPSANLHLEAHGSRPREHPYRRRSASSSRSSHPLRARARIGRDRPQRLRGARGHGGEQHHALAGGHRRRPRRPRRRVATAAATRAGAEHARQGALEPRTAPVRLRGAPGGWLSARPGLLSGSYPRLAS
jgi:hypothetical protein